MLKLAIVTTHPIQYYAPFFRLLAERGRVDLKVFYTWSQAIEGFDDPDFGKRINWDIPLLEGYLWEVSENISRNPGSKKWSGVDCPQLIEQVTHFHPDAVMVVGWNFKSHFKVMRHFNGKIPVWFTGDSTLLDEQPGIKRILRRLLLKFVYRYVDKAFYVGTNNKAYFKVHGLREEQLVFFPHAIDNERFADPDGKYEEQAQTWKKELGIPDGSATILFAGKIEPKKDPLLLIQAVKQINGSTDQQVHLNIVGDGPLAPEIHLLAKQYSWLHLLPFQNQSMMPVVYRLGHVFVLPSRGPGETWGLSINEAMSCGLPVVASDRVGCYPDLVQPGFNGEVFKSGDEKDLSTALTKVLTGDMIKFGENSLKGIRDWNYIKKCEAIEQFG